MIINNYFYLVQNLFVFHLKNLKRQLVFFCFMLVFDKFPDYANLTSLGIHQDFGWSKDDKREYRATI